MIIHLKNNNPTQEKAIIFGIEYFHDQEFFGSTKNIYRNIEHYKKILSESSDVIYMFKEVHIKIVHIKNLINILPKCIAVTRIGNDGKKYMNTYEIDFVKGFAILKTRFTVDTKTFFEIDLPPFVEMEIKFIE